MNILITGVAGFIGSNLADYLLKKGYNVIGIDDLSYGLIEQVPNKVDFHNIDILSNDIYHLMRNIDIVFHLAAKNCISDCQKDPVETVKINVLGTVNVFEAAKKNSVKRVVYAESSAIYEGCSTFPTNEKDENPQSFYAMSKMSSKFFSDAYTKFHNLDLIGLRYFNVYGPKQDYRRSVPPLMCALIIKMLSNERPTIYGNGSKRRDFIYIDDINNFHEILIKKDIISQKTFNLGFSKNYSVLEVFDAVKKLVGSNLSPIHLKDLPGEAFQNLSDIRNAKNLGWTPKIDLETGLKLTIDYIKQNVM